MSWINGGEEPANLKRDAVEDTYERDGAIEWRGWFEKRVNGRGVTYPVTVVLVALILVVVFHVSSLAPFGGGHRSLAVDDASIQYLDFFAYLKDALTGKNGLLYSFSKGIGGNMVAVVAYYLTSPFNFLVVFFAKNQLASFYDLLVLLKLCTAGLFMCLYLNKRFGVKLGRIFVILLSVSYTLMQYNLKQSRNVMWLDGVYMLPLLALGVYYCLNKQKTMLLAFSTFCTIVFNWYSGVLNGMFIVLLFGLELILSIESGSFRGNKSVAVLKSSGRFIAAGMTGICLSAFLLFPMVKQLGKGRGTFDLSVMEKAFYGSPVADLQGFAYGANSYLGMASLFSGAMVLFGFIGFFATREYSAIVKVSTGALFSIIWASFHFGPMFFVFSLFKSATSYWYRYSYLAIFVMVFCAAAFYRQEPGKSSRAKAYHAFAVFLLLLMILEYVKPVNGDSHTFRAVIAGVVVTCLFGLFSMAQRRAIRRFIAVVLVAACLVDLGYNAKVSFDSTETKPYQTYVNQQQPQIDAIQHADHSLFRITQTSTRDTSAEGVTGNYNEGFAFNYYPMATYTSDPDEPQRKFLDNLGYPKNGENYNIVNTPILSSDSLLGAKYVLSDYDVEGLEITDFPVSNGKRVYRNPYALPLAFMSDEGADKSIQSNGNPFDYQNNLYSTLLNRRVHLFKPVEMSLSEAQGSTDYHLYNIPDNSPVYGEINSIYTPSTLHLKNRVQNYSRWGAPSVIYIPQNGDSTADLSLSINDGSEQKTSNTFFYSLDLDELKEVTSELQKDSPQIAHWDNGDIQIRTDSATSKQMVMSVMTDASWEVTVDGKTITPTSIDGSLISIPLDAGHHTVTMQYHVDGLTSGSVVSIISLLAAIGIHVLWVKRRNRNQSDLNQDSVLEKGTEA